MFEWRGYMLIAFAGAPGNPNGVKAALLSLGNVAETLPNRKTHGGWLSDGKTFNLECVLSETPNKAMIARSIAPVFGVSESDALALFALRVPAGTSWDTRSSATRAYVTNPAANPVSEYKALKVLLVIDPHIVDDPAERYQRQIRDLRAAMADAVAWDADVFVVAGDLGNNLGANTAKALEIIGECAIPTVYCIGNHDEEELTGGLGHPNTAELEAIVGHAAPFNWTQTVAARNGGMSVLFVVLDGNYYADGPHTSPAHHTGDRIGFNDLDRADYFNRQLGKSQIDWALAQIAASPADMVIILFHYPSNVAMFADVQRLYDGLQSDPRPIFGLHGHIHGEALEFRSRTTDRARTFRSYRGLALQESGAWARISLTPAGIEEAVIVNYSNNYDVFPYQRDWQRIVDTFVYQ